MYDDEFIKRGSSTPDNPTVAKFTCLLRPLLTDNPPTMAFPQPGCSRYDCLIDMVEQLCEYHITYISKIISTRRILCAKGVNPPRGVLVVVTRSVIPGVP